tara:strand:+ start:620 stop:781 length:162 start_codon:yes stop_codon:yes gene_type:complete
MELSGIPSNARSDMFTKLFDSITAVKMSLYANANEPMLVTESGMETDDKESQL